MGVRWRVGGGSMWGRCGVGVGSRGVPMGTDVTLVRIGRILLYVNLARTNNLCEGGEGGL